MSDAFSERIWGIPWMVLAGLALLVAIVFVVIDTSAGATGLRHVVLRWFHSLCWLLLALAAVAMTRVSPLPAPWAGPLAGVGGVVYLIFLATSLVGGRSGA